MSQVWEGGSRPEMKQRNKHEIGIDSANKQGKIKLTIHYFPGLYGCNDGLRLGLCLPSSNACMPSASGPPDTAAPTLLQRSPAFRRCDFHNCCKACRIIFHDCSLPQTGKIKHVFVCIFCSVPFFRGKGIGAWGLEIGCCALGIGHWPWALGIGLWGEGCGDWSLGIALGIVGLPMADTKRRQSKRPTAKSLMSQSGDRRINRQSFFHTFDRHDSVVST